MLVQQEANTVWTRLISTSMAVVESPQMGAVTLYSRAVLHGKPGLVFVMGTDGDVGFCFDDVAEPWALPQNLWIAHKLDKAEYLVQTNRQHSQI